MRPIDADALMELFDERLDSAHLQTVTRKTGKTLWSGIYGGVNWGRNTIADAPTIDVVPVVRCKDCKQNSSGSIVEGLLWCQKFHAHRPPYGYCHYGERKDGGRDG